MAAAGQHPSEQELSEYLDGQLERGRRSQVAAHVQACSICRQSYQSLSATVSLLRQMPALDSPRDFRIGPRRARRGLAERLYPWTRALTGVAAALVVVLFALDFTAPPAPVFTQSDAAGQAQPASAALASTPGEASSTTAPGATHAPAAPAAPAQPAGAARKASETAPPSETPEGAILTAQGTAAPLPSITLTPLPLATQAPAPTPASVAPRARPSMLTWELLALGLAIALAIATLFLQRQARPQRA